MQFRVAIKNLGKIEEAKVDIKPLTILVGKNSIGKSFITKSLYCILNTLNKNHIALEIQKLTEGIDGYFSYFYNLLSRKQKYDLDNIRFLNKVYIPFLNSVVDKIEDKNIFLTEKIIRENREKFIELTSKLEKYIQRKKELKNPSSKKRKRILVLLKAKLDKLKRIFTNTREILINQIGKYINTSFKKNFQQKDIGTLIKIGSKKAIISLENIGSVEIDIDDKIMFKFLKEGIEEVGNLKNVVYLDSPVYLKLKKGLSRIKEPILFKEKLLKGYPLYIDELFNFLDFELIEENKIEFQKISKHIQRIVNGKFQRNEIGDFEFIEKNEYKIPLSLLAMGVSNIALIEYLIRNNIISKGSFLIIDEPESHLHPQWQVELVDVLYKIAQNGANVIIATHSINIIKAIEVIVREDEKAKDLIAINKMPYSSEFQEKSIIGKIEESLKELTEPYSNLVWRIL